MADIEELLQALTMDEKAGLTAGDDMFSLRAVERLGLPKIRVTDGPSGARGESFPGVGGPPSTCVPCGSAVGASWDPELARALGSLVAREARDRGCLGLLAPTVNLQRSPLAGRNFECYSEDPLLSGSLAVGYIQGVQAEGVFATVKHFVGNEAEFERNTIDSRIDERPLRELYLLPFEMAVRDGRVGAVMTSYNRLNGKWLTEQPAYLQGILREEWGFEGLVMTDWFAMADPLNSLSAGLDLEMPGPGRALGSRVAELVRTGAVKAGDLDAAVGRLLRGLDRFGALDVPPLRVAPAPPSSADLALLRRAAADTAVLLTNNGTLPLAVDGGPRIAVLGAHACRPTMVGGGSAGVIPHRPVDFRRALEAALGGRATVVHERGCEVDLSARLIGRDVLAAPDGFRAEVYRGDSFDGEPVHTHLFDELRVFAVATMTPGYPKGPWSLRLSGTVMPQETGRFELALAQSGRTRVFLDGELVLDGYREAPGPGGVDFFGQASLDLTARVDLTAGVSCRVEVEYASAGAVMAGFRVGFRTVDTDSLLERAVAAAAAADAAVVFVGNTEEWETEGRDRAGFELPGRQDELVRRVAEVNPRTVVVVNAGSPVAMPWSGGVAGVLQCWFGGQEMDTAVADVLLGVTEPGGRLAVTVPEKVEHNPSYDNFPGENGRVCYGEGLFMGYRGYDHRCIAPRFAFGHGLGYTTFEIGTPTASSAVFRPGDQLHVRVPVANVGDRPGAEVIQCYVAPVSARLARPPKELKAFAKVRLEPGRSTVVEMTLDDRSFAYWDPGQPDYEGVRSRLALPDLPGQAPSEPRRSPGWQVDPGSYSLLIGRSSDDLRHRLTIELEAP